MTGLDRTRPPRPGEELAQAPLSAYLRRELGLVANLVVEQFPGGHSNLTYLLRFELDGEGRQLVLRRPPFGSKVKRAHDMGREHRVLSALSPHRAWAPKPVLFCDDHAVLGCDFYLMERIKGVVLRRQLPEGVTLDAPTARRLCETLLDTLCELHALDYREVGLPDLGKPEGYVARQVSGWAERYDGSLTDDIAEMREVAVWLAAHMPVSAAATIIHNDYKFDNVVYDSTRFQRIVGVLDWEMATIGDPLMDLGTALCYWVEASDSEALKNLSFAPTMVPGMMTRRELADRYAERTGRDVSHILFYYTFGLFKTAVVLQQIYYRYAQGLTQDQRFAGLIHGVRLLAQTAATAIERDTLS